VRNEVGTIPALVTLSPFGALQLNLQGEDNLMSRRFTLKTIAASVALTTLPFLGTAHAADDTIKVGILHSLSGTAS